MAKHYEFYRNMAATRIDQKKAELSERQYTRVEKCRRHSLPSSEEVGRVAGRVGFLFDGLTAKTGSCDPCQQH